MLSNIVILGVQWGDEGKGKVVDYLMPRVHAVVRFQGGHNAGHTLVHQGQKTVLHLLPSGIMREDKSCYIGNGVALSLSALKEELAQIKAQGVEMGGRLKISQNCPLILPSHVALDRAVEKHLGKASIGTTGRGIGPAYEDRVARRAVRLVDIFDAAVFEAKTEKLLDYHNSLLEHQFKAAPVDPRQVIESVLAEADWVKPMVADVARLLHQLKTQEKRILFEGAQGFLLDVDHGTYPYVTSCNTSAAAAALGSGLGPLDLDYVLGVAKAYTTRVGNGPFPTELFDEQGHWLASKGSEFGATTGRPRRCGWLDVVALQDAVRVNSLSGLCLTKLDVLDGLKTIKICTAYSACEPGTTKHHQTDHRYTPVAPQYEELSGWTGSTAGLKVFEDLPKPAQAYILRLEELLGVPVVMVSTGAEREQVILRDSFPPDFGV